MYQLLVYVTWSTGATTNSITVSPTQTTRYYVTVTDGITTCTDSVLVTVSPVDTTLTLLDPPQICATGGTVRLQAGIASGYQWLLNGSAIPGATARNFSATAIGTYRVALINALGCRDTSRSISITIAPQPVVGFTINAPGQCFSGNQFFFTNTSTIGNGTLTYLWSFGDGATATTANATHSYAAPGTYQVKLVATSSSGCRDSAVNAVTVNPQPLARFTVTPSGQCLNTNLYQFTNTSTLSSGTFTSFWTFGDGNSSNATNPSHVYATAGTYSVKLVVTSNVGCRDSIIIPVSVYPKPIVSYSVNTAAQCVNGNLFQFTNTSTINSGTLSYLWRFGDGSTATTTHASYSYASSGTFVVWLIATSNNGCKDSTSRVVTVNPKPVVSFTVNSPGQCVNGNQFIFTSTSTISSGTMSYFWTFGDGITANTGVANHTYLSAGTYTVKLVVTSNLNCRDSVSQTVTVYPKPAVGFTVNNPAQCLNGNNFQFTNTSTISSGTLTYIWDFGDGGTATSINAAYSYAAEGVYVVKLVAISNSGCRDSSTSVITVYPKPVVSFTVNASRQCQVGNLFQFANTSTIGNGTMTFSWDFGDGVTSTSQSTSHSYANPGTYVVKLRALSNNGCADSTSQTVTVDPSPVTAFTVSQPVQCFFGHQFSFLNNSSIASGSIQFLWDFGDGIGTSSVRNPVYSYAGPGTYTVTLTCVSNFNCSTQFSLQVIVRPTPTGTIFTAGSTVICEGSFITLSATGGDTYQWLLNGQPITGATSATFPATDAGTYGVILTNTFGCSATASNTITLTKVFQPTVDFSYDSYCVSLPVAFTNLTDTSRTGRVLYEWNFGDGGTSFVRNPTHVFRDSTTYAVRLAVTPLDCPNLGSSVTKSISFQPAPIPVRYPSINAVSARNLELSARLFTGARYVWQPGTSLSNASIRTPVFNGTSAQQYLIQITTVAGCPVTDTLQVRMFSQRDIYVPDAFSPNGDGKNDRLLPLLVGITELKSFRVYDRWGQLLFQTNKVGDGWDGYFRGTKQPMETYTWIAEARDLDGNSLQKRGTSILLR